MVLLIIAISLFVLSVIGIGLVPLLIELNEDRKLKKEGYFDKPLKD